MDLVSGVIGFILGMMIGSGAVLLYIRRQFTSSMQRFQEEMDLLEDEFFEPSEIEEEEEN